MRNAVTRYAPALAVSALLLLATGCFGRFDNTYKFINEPRTGQAELEMLKQYGIPNFTTSVEGQRIYGYKVRRANYYVFLGLYDGYDMLIVCRDGRVVETRKVLRPETVTILQPVPWAVSD